MLDWQQIDAVIFDMDGTLVDSMYYWHTLPLAWFAEIGVTAPADLDEQLGAKDLWQAAAYFSQNFAPQIPPEEIFNTLQQQIDYHYAHDIDLLPGTADFLAALRQAGKRLCIATMTDRPQIETVLNAHQLNGVFDFLLTTPEVGKGKEQPDIFLQACQRFAAPPERVAVFEDSHTAARTALGLAMPLVLLCPPGADCSDICTLAQQKQGNLTVIQDYLQLLADNPPWHSQNI